jgi:hypothetical protein
MEQFAIPLDGLFFIGIGNISYYGRATFHNLMNPPSNLYTISNKIKIIN